jgi:hypothetical protein
MKVSSHLAIGTVAITYREGLATTLNASLDPAAVALNGGLRHFAGRHGHEG